MSEIFPTGDWVVKILSVGASGLALLLAILSYRLIEKPADGTGAQQVELYKARLRSVNFFLGGTLALFVISLVGQYFLDSRKAKIALVIQEGSALLKFKKDFQLEPIRVKHGVGEEEIPTKQDKDRLVLILRADDQVDISLSSLVEFISHQASLLVEKDRQIAASSRNQGGFDEPR
jgi:hypothetical protein